MGKQSSPPFSGSGSCTLWAEIMILRSRSQLRMVCVWVLQLSLGWRCFNLSSGWQLSSHTRIQNWPDHLRWSTYPCQLGCERKILSRKKVDRKEKRKEECELWEAKGAQNLTLVKNKRPAHLPTNHWLNMRQTCYLNLSAGQVQNVVITQTTIHKSPQIKLNSYSNTNFFYRFVTCTFSVFAVLSV